MVADALFSSKTDDWETPKSLFDKLDATFHFDIDVCASKENAKCAKYFTREQDGLKQDGGGGVIWCNPPYGREIGQWVKRCAERSPGIAVMLIPARTDTKWWHEYIDNNPHAQVHFIKGRLKFGGAKNSAPFPSAIVVFWNVKE